MLKTRKQPPGTAIDALVFLLHVAIALAITRPWILHPLSTTIGFNEPPGIESTDLMANATFAGWLRFAALELHEWPLGHSRYLLFPYGASFGLSYDSLLMALQVALMDIFLPLLLAQNVAIVLAFVLCGFASYGLFKRLWGRGLLALTMSVSAICIPYLVQRATGHTNLLSIWTLPVSMHAFESFRARPTWKRSAALALSVMLLALASWYILIMGLVYLSCVSVVSVLASFQSNRSDALRFIAKLGSGWALGVALAITLGLPMLEGYGARQRPTFEFMHMFSTPAVQYLLPYPGSLFSRLPFVYQAQQSVATSWEGLAAVPIASFLLFYHFAFFTPNRERRFSLLLAGTAAFVYSLGPYLQLAHVVPHDTTLQLPLGYLAARAPIFTFFRVPGRMHVVLFFVALIGSGHLLQHLRPRIAKWHAAAWPAVLCLVLALNLAWTLTTFKIPTFPNPRVPKFFVELGENRGTGAVFDVPFDYYSTGRYNFYQFEHKRPAVTSVLYHDSHTQDSLKFLHSRPTVQFFTGSNKSWADEHIIDQIISPEFMKDLAAHRVEYFVVHEQFLRWFAAKPEAHPDTLSIYARIEAAWANRLVYQDDLVRVYSTALSE